MQVNPEQAVIDVAVQRGYLRREQLDQALAQQAQLRQQGQPTTLLPLLAGCLTPAQQSELRQVFLAAQAQQGTSEATVVQLPPAQRPPTAAFDRARLQPPPSASFSRGAVQAQSDFGTLPRAPQPNAPTLAGGAPAPPSGGPPPGALGGPTGSTSGGWGADLSASSFANAQKKQTELPEPGDLVGPYRLIRAIARGGMGIVYEGQHETLDRRVALKLLLDLKASDDSPLVQRFLVEAKESARLNHPNIACVFDVGRDAQGRHFMAMEYLEGETLKDRLKRDGPLPSLDAAELVLALAKAVDYAHQQGILHRDLKPSNVLVTHAGEPKLLDFGLAKNLEQSQGLTKTGEVMGTPAYMPPEQASGAKHEIGPHSDVWGLGATLYTLVCGRPPFSGASVVNIISKVLAEEPAPPRSIAPSVDPTLEAIVLKCLEKPLEERYRSAGELIADLEAFLGPRGSGVRARRRSSFARWAGRNRGLVAVSLLGCLGVAAATALALQPGPAPNPTPTPLASATPTPTPQPSATPQAELTRLVIDAQSFSDLEQLPGLRVEEALALHVSPRGLRLRGHDGYGPKLILPLHYRRGPLRLRAKLAVRYMGAEATISLLLREPRSPEEGAATPGQTRLGPIVSELTYLSRVHQGEVQWGARLSYDKAQAELAWREVRKRDEEVELELAYDGEGRLSARLGQERLQLDSGLASGDYEAWLMVGSRPANLPFPYPRFVDALLESFEVGGVGLGVEPRRDETTTHARIGRAGRALRAGVSLAEVDQELKLLGQVPSGLVRNRAILLIANGLAESGQIPESADAFAGFYGVNLQVQAERKQLRGATRAYPAWRFFPTLSELSQRALVQGHLSFYGVGDEVAQLRADAQRYLPNPQTPRAALDLHALEALVCLLRLQQLRAEVEPLHLGLAWLYSGDPEQGYRWLSQAAEQEPADQVDAKRLAGLAAYLTRRFADADRLWSAVEAARPGGFPSKGSWAFRRARAQRIVGSRDR